MEQAKVTIHTILEEFRQVASSSRDLGDKFERLILTYLRVDPLYYERFDDAWMWMDWSGRRRQPDTGIDLVARERATGGYCAIQCKFYSPDHTLEKSDIDSFFTASGTADFSSRMIVSTTDRWSKHAIAACENQQIPVTKLFVKDLAESPIDWSTFSSKKPETLQLLPKKCLRPHQTTAVEKVMAGFKTADRGKLIMACGTGKTFTGLKIAEEFVKNSPNHSPNNTSPKTPATVLFLVPSIALLSQTLREWTAETSVKMQSIAVCSDAKASKRQADTEDMSIRDLAYPATTNAQEIADRSRLFSTQIEGELLCDLVVVFSTYQSLQAIADAQGKGLPEFDLILCDEAHRTTGATVQGQDESYFVRIHDQTFIRGKKRLYMTATPRLYGDNAKAKAQENDILICSMDDEELYGKELHRLGFGEAVNAGLLTDYRVMVLAVDEKYVSATFQRQLADTDNQLNLEDAVKITGCWNGLSKRMAIDANGEAIDASDRQPMRRAVAFSQSIKDSKRIIEMFSQLVKEYKQTHPQEEILECELDHVDGKQNVLERHAKLDWLKAETSGNVCRILSNVRCLSEGVDVPALDAVMFLSPRGSVVDVVQSVGRVMRLAPGKKYGYIILPVGIPAGIAPEEALKDNEKYKVIWQVLQALRAHDDRFNATVNKLELTQERSPQLNVIGVTGNTSLDGDGTTETISTSESSATQLSLHFPELEEWRNAIYAKIVQKCGDRRYWEQWAADVAKIADSHIWRIKALLESANSVHRQAFTTFLAGLHENINPNVTEDDAIEMLAQHLITKPVFDALFEGYSFTEQNPVSIAMQTMLNLLEGESLEKDTAKLTKFYESVRQRASGINKAEGKQKIIVELYDKFFRNAFPRMSDRLGIVYTPIEVVDFIINSADRALRQEFGVGLTSPGVHVLDPFTGTGTFMVRLLQSGLIKREDLERKFKRELHANEIVLLAYYIAAINIEETYHGLTFPQPLAPSPNLTEGEPREYQPFEGIVLTDTFQMFEGSGTLMETMFPENNQRVQEQKQQDIRVIIGNPPYSAGQGSENDGNKNLKYPQLDSRIAETYAKYSSATLKNSLYDSYIRAIRWASDRIQDKGIICFVSNGSFIDNNAMDGLRKCLVDEFSRVYCFNLRGNQRTSGETSRQEGGKIFGSGSRASIAITLFIKNPEHTGNCQLFYHDIGDYLSREEKLEIIRTFGGIGRIDWQVISPNQNHDWINQRDPAFDAFLSLGDKKDPTTKTIFDVYSAGVKTNRDAWCYNFSRDAVAANMGRMIDFYNEQVDAYQALPGEKPSVDKFIDTDPKKISWSGELKEDLGKLRHHSFIPEQVIKGIYRPFCKQFYYFNKDLNNRLYQMPKIFPIAKRLHRSIAPLENLVICTTAVGAQKDFSALIANVVPNLHFQHTGNCFPLYTYTKQSDLGTLFATTNQPEYIRNENIPDAILTDFQTTYNDPKITKEDIFYYVYGILHSPEYKTRFAADLKKMLPRIPYAADFWAFCTAGRNLAHWHLHYETIEPYPLEEYKENLFVEAQDYRVQKMSFGRNKGVDKTTIIYNSKVKLAGIPLEAYEYKVCDRSAIEWIMERYQVTKDKASGIVNDPNNWSDDPHYIVDLVKRIVRVSLETVQIVNSLPSLNDRN
jgi:predicted helicase